MACPIPYGGNNKTKVGVDLVIIIIIIDTFIKRHKCLGYRGEFRMQV